MRESCLARQESDPNLKDPETLRTMMHSPSPARGSAMPEGVQLRIFTTQLR